jgi:hypothetical protein
VEIRENRYHDNLSLRVSAMKGELTEKQFRDALQLRLKRSERLQEINAILASFATCLSDLLRRWRRDEVTADELREAAGLIREVSVDSYRNVLLLYGGAKDSQLFKNAGALFAVSPTPV